MKKILFLAATALLCASCFHVNSNFKGFSRVGGKNSVKGEGPVISKSLDFKDFDAIEINGQADIDFVQGDAWEVTLRTQENIFDYVDYRVDGSTLVIQLKDKKTAQAEVYDLTVQAPALRRITVNGAGDFNILRGLVSDGDFKVEVNGAGDMEFNRIRCKAFSVQANGAADVKADDIDVESVSIQVNGAGDVTLSGNAGKADLEVNGAGDIDATSLTVAGDVKKHAAGLAKIRL